MKCDCADCGFRGAAYCEHRKLMDENAELKRKLKELADNIRPVSEFHISPAKWIDPDEMYHWAYDAIVSVHRNLVEIDDAS